MEILKDAGDAQPGGTSFDPSAIYQRESPGVVTITSTGLDNPNGSGPNEAGVGSGFVISGDGEIATNAHVVTSGEGASIHKAQQVYVHFKDGNQVSAEVVGLRPVRRRRAAEGRPRRPDAPAAAARLRRATSIVGAPVAAIGSPFGKDESLSVGVVSALDRSIDSLTGFATPGAIQTDAAINHGNSGGPLLDARGRVLGINAQIQTSSGDGSGVGFAVPVDAVKRSLGQLREDGKVALRLPRRLDRAALSAARAALQRRDRRTARGCRSHGAGRPGRRRGPEAAAIAASASRAARTRRRRRDRRGGGHAIREEDDLARRARPARGRADGPGRRCCATGERRALRVKLGERPLDARAG